MGNYHIGDGECRFRVVCSSPDVCEVGGYKVPFDSYQTLDSERQYSSTVLSVFVCSTKMLCSWPEREHFYEQNEQQWRQCRAERKNQRSVYTKS